MWFQPLNITGYTSLIYCSSHKEGRQHGYEVFLHLLISRLFGRSLSQSCFKWNLGPKHSIQENKAKTVTLRAEAKCIIQGWGKNSPLK